MQGEKEKVRDTTESSGEQPAVTARAEEANPVGQDSAGSEYGGIGEKSPSGGSARPRSLGTRGADFGQFADRDDSGQQGQSGTGQADLGSQGASTLSGRTDQQDLGEAGGEVDQPRYRGGTDGIPPNTEGEGFILQQGSPSADLHLDENPSSAEATEGIDFAAQGRGAPEDESDR